MHRNLQPLPCGRHCELGSHRGARQLALRALQEALGLCGLFRFWAQVRPFAAALEGLLRVSPPTPASLFDLSVAWSSSAFMIEYIEFSIGCGASGRGS